MMDRRQFIIGSAALGVSACGSRLERVRPVADQFVSVEGKRLRYRMAGDGPPVILLHGASGNLSDWTFDHFDDLARNHTGLVFDRPGLGLSDPPDDPSLSTQARLMRLAAQKLGMERATIVGHSFGGSIALAWALDAPAFVEGLVLLSAPSHVWPGSAGRLYDIAGIPVVGYLFSQLVPVLANERRIRQAVAAIYAPQEVPEGYIAHVDAQISVQADVFRANTAQIGALKPQIREMVPGYAGLTIPVEIIHGRADEVVPAQIHSEPLSKVLPNGRLTLLDGIGHMPHHVAPDVFRKALSRVIAAR